MRTKKVLTYKFNDACTKTILPYKFKDTVLFNDTVYYNIAYGNVTASREEVEHAAQMADMHKVITRMHQGYDTPVCSAFRHSLGLQLNYGLILGHYTMV